MIGRRTFLSGVAAGLVTAPLAAQAQQTKQAPLVATLSVAGPDTARPLLEAFKQGLLELGYIDGQNIRFHSAYGMGKIDQLPQLAQELVALKPDVIFVGAGLTARAAQQATTTIPIVGTAFDPVSMGLVKNLVHPEGNLTGLSSMFIDTSPKFIEFLRTLMPKLSRAAVLLDPAMPGSALILKNLQTAAQSVGLNLLVIGARTPPEIDDAFTRIVREKVRAVIVLSDAFLLAHRREIAALALKDRIASTNFWREMVEAGGLMSYGQNLRKHYRHAAIYVDKILRGAKPGDLPIERSTELELVVNMKTARALGLSIPQLLMVRADEVIQ